MFIYVNIVVTWSGDSLGYFKIIVHVEASFGYVKIISFDAFFLSGVLSLANDLLLVEMQGGKFVLLDVPREVFVGVVAVNLFRRDHRFNEFGVLHFFVIGRLIKLNQYLELYKVQNYKNYRKLGFRHSI